VSEIDDPDDRPSTESSRQPQAKPKSHRAACVLLFSIFSLTGSICGAVLYVKFQKVRPAQKPVNNEQRVLDEADRLQAQGMAAYKEWSQARRDGDSATEKQKHGEAFESFSAAMDTLNRLLDRYRDADGMLLPAYEGYEEQLSDISIRLGDLVRGARVDTRGSR
jgi:hypothetical protein